MMANLMAQHRATFYQQVNQYSISSSTRESLPNTAPLASIAGFAGHVQNMTSPSTNRLISSIKTDGKLSSLKESVPTPSRLTELLNRKSKMSDHFGVATTSDVTITAGLNPISLIENSDDK